MLSSKVCRSGYSTRQAGQRRQSLFVRATAEKVAVANKTDSYFVVKNVFKVKEDSYTDFEEVWKARESHLKEMPGFIRFAMLKCINIPGKYVSETHWQKKADFDAWTSSPQFKASHGGNKAAEDGKPKPSVMTMVEGPPSPELYETVTTTSME